MNAREVLSRFCGTTASIRKTRRQISKEIAVEKREAVLALAYELIDRDPNSRWVAYELVQHHHPTRDKITAVEVERLGEGLSNWGSVDAFACFVSGPAWREGHISDAVIRRWAKSKDRWWRRAALVSTVPLNVRARGGSGDAARTLAICELLLADRDEIVVKALSWALRALVKPDPAAVGQFMEKFADELAPLVKREVRNKLTTGLKNPRH
jgi:3-methyladenine DNA glycosylase AlkD